MFCSLYCSFCSDMRTQWSSWLSFVAAAFMFWFKNNWFTVDELGPRNQNYETEHRTWATPAMSLCSVNHSTSYLNLFHGFIHVGVNSCVCVCVCGWFSRRFLTSTLFMKRSPLEIIASKNTLIPSLSSSRILLHNLTHVSPLTTRVALLRTESAWTGRSHRETLHT